MSYYVCSPFSDKRLGGLPHWECFSEQLPSLYSFIKQLWSFRFFHSCIVKSSKLRDFVLQAWSHQIAAIFYPYL